MQHGYICIAVLNLKDYPSSNVIANGGNIRWNFWPVMANAKKREFYKAVRGVQKESARCNWTLDVLTAKVGKLNKCWIFWSKVFNVLNILIKSGKSAALSDLNSVKCADCIHGQWFARSVDQIDFIKDAPPLNCHGMYSHLSSETLQLGRENSQHQNFISFAEKTWTLW